jgi:hypothetical protein
MNYKINKGHFCHFHCSCVEQVLGISYFVSVNTLALWSLRSLLRLHVYMLVAHCSPTKVTSVDCYATPEIDLETIKKLMFRGPSAKEGPQQVWFLILWGLGLSHIISRSIDRSFFWMVQKFNKNGAKGIEEELNTLFVSVAWERWKHCNVYVFKRVNKCYGDASQHSKWRIVVVFSWSLGSPSDFSRDHEWTRIVCSAPRFFLV